MASKKRQFTAEFMGRVALEALQGRDSVEAIAARHELHPDQVRAWKRQLLDAAPEVFAEGGMWKRAKEHEGDDPRPAREDRRTHGGAGLFSARVEGLSRPERLRMIEPDQPLGLSESEGSRTPIPHRM